MTRSTAASVSSEMADPSSRASRSRAVDPGAGRNRIVGSGEEAPDQLLANPADWRVHPKAQQQALAGLLGRVGRVGRVGWVKQVLVNRRTGHVVDGHLRVALAIKEHTPAVPVLYVDLEPDEEALVLASLDPRWGRRAYEVRPSPRNS